MNINSRKRKLSLLSFFAVVISYISFWCIFYGIFFVVPEKFFANSSDKTSALYLFYVFILVPGLSFFIPYLVQKKIHVKLFLLYFFHTVVVLLCAALFFVYTILNAFSNGSFLGL